MRLGRLCARSSTPGTLRCSGNDLVVGLFRQLRRRNLTQVLHAPEFVESL